MPENTRVASVATRVDEAGLPSSPTAPASHTLREKLGRMFRRQSSVEVDAKREATLLQMKKGYNEVVETMQAVRLHMDHQTQRADRLVQIMETMPQLLESMPAAAASQIRILEGLQTHLVSQQATADHLSSALTTATESQKQVSTHLKQQLGAQAESSREMSSTLGGLNATLNQVGRANESTHQAYLDQAQQTRDLFQRTHRQMMMLILASAGVAGIALGVALYLVIRLS